MGGIRALREEALTRPCPGWHVDLGIPASKTMQNRFLLCLSGSVYGTFVTVAQTD